MMILLMHPTQFGTTLAGLRASMVTRR